MTAVQYRISTKLAQGYMGEVYRAVDLEHDRDVALKFLPARFTREDDIARFRQESIILSKLDHPNIVKVYKFGENIECRNFEGPAFEPTQKRVYFIVDEFIPGVSLRQYLAENNLSPKQALQIAIQIGRALAHAHSKGVIHRDVKPDNVMITPERKVKVLDFGLAQITDWFITQQLSLSEAQHVASVVTGPDEALGTASYMSPEQWGQAQRDRQKRIDHRTDVWSLGVVLYEMLTRINPFAAHTKVGITLLIGVGKPAPLSDHIGRRSRGLQQIVSNALKKDRADRYQTMVQMLQDMEKVQTQLETDHDRLGITSLLQWRPWSRS